MVFGGLFMMFRSVGRALAPVVVSVGLLVATPGAASADGTWLWSDGFEGDPSLTWEFDWGGEFQIDQGTARTGSNNAYLPVNSDFVSVRTTLPVPSWIYSGTNWDCQATARVKALTNSNGHTTADINFEVIDEPSWTYMALRNYKVTTGSWTKISTPYWNSGDETPALRVSLLKNSAPIQVDDVEVSCYGWTTIRSNK
jgi:hypothetical protein